MGLCSVSRNIPKYSSGKFQTRSPTGDQYSYGFTIYLTSALDGAGRDSLDALSSGKMSGIHCRGGWVGPGPAWTGKGDPALDDIRSLDCSACSKSLYRLNYPCPLEIYEFCFILFDFVLR